MIAVTLSEFRKNYKKYLDQSEKERVILTNKGKTYELLAQDRISDTDDYFSNSGVLKSIREAEEDVEAGRIRRTSAAELISRMGL